MENACLSICPLASGSRGNSVYVCGGDSAILMDAGLSGIELKRRLAARGLSPDSLKAVVVSHEHTDHVKGAGIMSRRYNIPLYINKKTYDAAAQKLGQVNDIRYFECGCPFEISGLKINPFSISHDAVDTAGFTLSYKGIKLGIATDLGVATNLVKEHFKGCSGLYIEANHDPDMLHKGPYPWYLKQRIKSRLGHLSNYDSGRLLCEVKNGCLKNVILAHLSEENNHPDIALQTVHNVLGTPDIDIDVAMPHEPGRIIHLNHHLSS